MNRAASGPRAAETEQSGRATRASLRPRWVASATRRGTAIRNSSGDRADQPP